MPRLPPWQHLVLVGEQHDRVFIPESATVNAFHAAPTGRAITLVYWYFGNCLGVPCVSGRPTYLDRLGRAQHQRGRTLHH